MAGVGYIQSLGRSANRHVEVVKQIVTVHIARPVAELNQADSFVWNQGRVYVNIRFAAPIVRVIKQNKVAWALEGISAKAIP